MGIYDSPGYVNIEKILSYKVPFNFIIGGRGTGKTYGALKYVIEHNKKFLLMRRTQSQCDLINKPEFNPFKAYCTDNKKIINVKAISNYNSVFYEGDEFNNALGYTCALSTIANMRGFDASDVKLLIYDEFIPELHERNLKNEGIAFLNAYETINRNRELKGNDPLQVLGLANAFNIANALFIELDLVSRCERMIKKEQELFIDRDKGILLAILNNSIISKKKKETALYKVSQGSFSEMSVNNNFCFNDTSGIKSESLNEYKIVCKVGDISIYKHKNERKYYISEHFSGSGDVFNANTEGLLKYRKKYGLRLYGAYVRENIIFENILTKALFEDYTIK